MHQKSRSIKILGLSLLVVVGLMAVSVSAAQAVGFRIEGKTLPEGENASVKGAIGESKFGVWNLGLQIKCPNGTIEGKIFGGGKVSAQIAFSGCEVVESKFCKLYPTKADLEAKTNAGKITSASEGKARLHGGKHYLQFESKAFNTVFIGGAGCTLPKEMLASGSAAIEVPNALTEMVTQQYTSISSETEALLGVSLVCASEPASVVGSSGSMSLTGAYEGKKWSFQ